MKLYYYCIFLLFVVIIISCSKNTNTTAPRALRVELNTTTVYTDGLDELVVTVFDADNSNVTANCTVLIDNNPIAGNRYKANSTKSYSVKAVFNGKESNTLNFTAARHEVNKFSKKIVIEEFSGMWCSFCTQFTYHIDTIVKNNNKIIPISIHSGDLLEYRFVNQLRSRFKTTDFPSAYVNRFAIWDESSAMLLNELNRKSKCGLSINTSINNDQVNATVKVKFDITTSESLSILVVLLEDSLIYPQSNFYNTSNPSNPFYGLGDPILNYRHNNTLQLAATDIFGDVIPVAAQMKNETWEKSYTFNMPGYNLANCKVAAFIQYTVNNVSRWGVLNAQVAKVGSLQDFD